MMSVILLFRDRRGGGHVLPVLSCATPPLASSFGRSTTLDFPSWEDSKRFVDRPCLRITDCYTAWLAIAVGLR